MRTLQATFISMFDEPISTWLETSLLGRAQKNRIIQCHVKSVLKALSFDHHAADDTPYGGGPGELLKIDVLEPLIKNALARYPDIPRTQKRVLLMDPAGTVFNQAQAKLLASYEELIFVCGRYEGFDARIYHYIDDAISLGDFVLSSGDLAAMAIFDATVRHIDGFLGNQDSPVYESHQGGRLEGSLYTRPKSYDGHDVPEVFCKGNHGAISKARDLESLVKTKILRPDLIQKYPLTKDELALLEVHVETPKKYPWMKP
jgi:tRNA (guanine37-N1)-methyltransferase